jgi:NADPH:quinone reductase-like Zn-dependent oxidoreductase
MHAYRLNQIGHIDGLELGTVQPTLPGRHEITVRVRASSLNARDLMVINGQFAFPLEPGLVPLSDGAGEVIAVGEDVTRVKVGDRVASTYFLRWIAGKPRIEYAAGQLGIGPLGMLSDVVTLDHDAVVHIPDHLSFEEAATLPCAAVTAWTSLFGPVPLQPGETVLTQGSGGVSIFILQLATLFGARVIMTTSTDVKAARLRQLGAHDVITLNESTDWPNAVRSLTGGRGADHLIELGGIASLGKSIGACALGAQIALVGVLGGSGSVDSSAFSGISGVVTLRRITVGSRQDFEAMNRAIGLHGLRPVIDRIFPFVEAKEAFRYMESGQHIGKIVIAHQ